MLGNWRWNLKPLPTGGYQKGHKDKICEVRKVAGRDWKLKHYFGKHCPVILFLKNIYFIIIWLCQVLVVACGM